ncbi:MAG: biopolymer transporter ExbD [Acidobacteria bacterium]|nr:biopolymer transporter ExbD [Acidobacteriota bacterium]
MSAEQRDNDARPYINVTPLIDVLLVLLIIFMVVTPLKPSRFKALVPTPLDARQQPIPPIDTLLRVDILTDTRLQLNGHDMGSVNDTTILSSTLSDLFQKRTDAGTMKFGTSRIEKTVYIKAPRSLKYSEVVKVIDSIKGAGADPVGLQVDDLMQ